jgi:glycosyltransferase involved in cell wall biosynthesis
MKLPALLAKGGPLRRKVLKALARMRGWPVLGVVAEWIHARLLPVLAKGGKLRRRTMKGLGRLAGLPIVCGLVARSSTTVGKLARARRRSESGLGMGDAAAVLSWTLVGPLLELAWFAVHAPLALLRRVPVLGLPVVRWEAWRVRRSGLLDEAWYAASNPGVTDAALDFVRRPPRERSRPHPLFDPRFYLAQRPFMRLAGIDPVLHYSAFGRADEIDPGPLFDASYYLGAEPAVDDGGEPALLHYLRGGWRAHAAAHPLFDRRHFLRRQPWLQEPDLEPLTHFAERGATDVLDPHPCFDARYYLQQNRDVLDAGANPLEHYLVYGAAEGRDPSPMFDTAHYVSKYPDVSALRMNPLVHFVRHGAAQGRTPARTLPPPWDPRSREQTGRRVRPGRPKAFFVLPDGNDGPLARLTLELMAHFERERGLECVAILRTDGPLFERFERHGAVLVEEHVAGGPSDGAAALHRLGTADTRFAVVASLRCADTALALDAAGVPVLGVLDTIPESTQREAAERLVRHSKRIVASSQAVLDGLQALCPLEAGQGRVLPLAQVRVAARRHDRAALRRELTGRPDLPDDALIVLGFGERGDEDAAPDFDRISARLQEAAAGPVHRVWVQDDEPGADAPPPGLPTVPATEDLSGWFVAADVVVSTAVRERQPSKVLAAMALGRPVVAYAARGEERALAGEGGGRRMMVGDVAGTTLTLQALLADPAALAELGRAARRLVSERSGAGSGPAAVIALIEGELGAELNTGRSGTRPTRPRVLFTTPTWGISGVNTFTSTLIAGLNRRGFDAELLFTGPQSPSEHSPDVPHRYLDEVLPGPGGPWSQGRWARLIRFLSDGGPCVFVPGFDYFASAVCPALPDEVGCLGVVHSDDFEHYEHAERLGRYWNALVGVSERCYERMLDVAPELRPVAHHIPYGIVLPEKRARPVRPASEPLRIVYTGRIEQVQKNVLALPGLVRELETRGVPFVLTLVGEGSMLESLRWKLADSIAAGRVRLAGRMNPEQVQAELAANDVFLLVSFFEGLPVAMLEAMASGCVPVVSDIESGVPQLVREGVTGLRAPVHDLAAFAAHLQTLAGDRELLARMSAAAVELVHGRYGDERMCDDYAAVLHEIWREVTLGIYRRPATSVPPSELGPVLLPPWLQRDASTFP